MPRRQSVAGVDVSEEDALSLSGVFAAVQLLSSIIGALPLNVYRKNGNRREVAADLLVQSVLHDEYNPEMTASIGRRTNEFHRLLWGNEFTEIQRTPNGDVFALWPIEPWRVTMKRREDDALGWLIDGVDWIADRDMLRTPLISMDGVEGRSFVDFALKSLGLGIAMQDFSERFFGNDAKPGGLLKHPGNPKSEARKEFRKTWTEEHGGPGKAGRVGVLWGGWEWQAGDATMELEKAQLLETKRFQIEELARWFNLPPHLLRDLSRATFSNIEHQGIDFVVYSLTPPLVNKEQEYKRKLLKQIDPGLYCKHNVAALLRGDSAARSAFYKELWMLGVLSQNDIRELEDMNPIEGGDVYYVPVNMQSISKANAPAPEPKPDHPAPQNPPPPAENDAPRMQAVLADVLTRLGKKQANEARRAAKKPEQFLDWIDEFYPKFESTLAQALAPIDDNSADIIAADYCAYAREIMLDIAGSAKPQELYVLVDLKLNEWSITHPIGWAVKALEKIKCQSST